MEEIWLTVLALTDSMVRVALPLILAALGGLYAERSGVIDLGLEGKLLMGAFAAAAIAALTGSAWAGLGMAIVTGVSLSMIHGYACITHKGNQVVSGMAINIAVVGLASVLALAIFGQPSQTPLLPDAARFTPIELPFADAARAIPIVGSFYAEVVSGHNILVYLTALLVPLLAWLLYRTRYGLRLRAAGENPSAVDTAGISVARMRYSALVFTGILCGIGGAYLSTAQTASFVQHMSAGKGFLALAALIFGKWRPYWALSACLLFAFADAVQIRLQGVELPVVGVVPVQAIQALPYILTVILLAGFVGKAVAPKASGIPYEKERR